MLILDEIGEQWRQTRPMSAFAREHRHPIPASADDVKLGRQNSETEITVDIPRAL